MDDVPLDSVTGHLHPVHSKRARQLQYTLPGIQAFAIDLDDYVLLIAN